MYHEKECPASGASRDGAEDRVNTARNQQADLYHGEGIVSTSAPAPLVPAAKRVTIIRRKRNRNYTVIGNRPMNDERLSAEALGLLTYLLSRPDDWNVVPSQLATRFNCGRDKMQRIIRELVDAGYIVRLRVRNVKEKTFARTEYLVFDEPEAVGEHPEAYGQPQPEKPSPAFPSPANPPLLNKDKKPNTESHQCAPARARGRGGLTPEEQAAFERFKRLYPRRDDANPMAGAQKAFARLIKAGVAPDLIHAAAERYAAEMRKKEKVDTQYVKRAANWLAEQDWSDLADQEASRARTRETASSQVYLKASDPRFARWNQYFIDTGGLGSPTDANGGWWFDSEEPPARLEAAEAAA
jgi:hypothetical protein